MAPTRRGLEARTSSREPPKSSAQPVQSSNEDDYVTAAKEMQANLGKDEFIFVAYGNYAFVELFNNWMCNTAFMNGVHARTLIIMTDDDGYDEFMTS